MLFDRHLGQGASVITLVAADAKFLDPLFLDIGLAAFGAHEHALLI
jgi:hypothetical protein